MLCNSVIINMIINNQKFVKQKYQNKKNDILLPQNIIF